MHNTDHHDARQLRVYSLVRVGTDRYFDADTSPTGRAATPGVARVDERRAEASANDN